MNINIMQKLDRAGKLVALTLTEGSPDDKRLNCPVLKIIDSGKRGQILTLDKRGAMALKYFLEEVLIDD